MTHDCRPLTFETLLHDPLVRAVMQSDGVTLAELVAVLAAARTAVVRRERQAVRRALGTAGGGPGIAAVVARQPPP